MEVHAHTHTARKKWTHYLWEFLMLFLAVFCGFLAENLREHKIEHIRAKDYARSLVQDFQNDTSAIHKHKKSAAIYIDIVDTLLNLNKTKLDGSASSRFSLYTRFLYWTAPIIWNRATYEQIRNSGSLRYFKNYKLLEKLMKYEALIDAIEAEAYNRQVRGNLLLKNINTIIEPGYHQELSKYFLDDLDTMPGKAMESIYPAVPVSLENKRNEINEMLNMSVVQQRNLQREIDLNWKQAEELALILINEFKDEYHLE
ncbi:MAG: hypothetical protein ABI688_00175 [Bacteroidota bacterium]